MKLSQSISSPTISFTIGLLLTGAIFAVAPKALAQQTVYISDILYVPVRSGRGNQYRIIDAALRSGTPLTFVEEGPDGEWTKVRKQDGTEGWIRSQYLVEEVPARDRLAQALTRAANLESQLEELAQENRELKAQNAELKALASSKTASSEKMAEELEHIRSVSAGALELEKRYQDLLEQHQILKTETEALTAENEQLLSNRELNFMFYGAGLMLAGVLLAVILPHLRRKNRFSDWAN